MTKYFVVSIFCIQMESFSWKFRNYLPYFIQVVGRKKKIVNEIDVILSPVLVACVQTLMKVRILDIDLKQQVFLHLKNWFIANIYCYPPLSSCLSFYTHTYTHSLSLSLYSHTHTLFLPFLSLPSHKHSFSLSIRTHTLSKKDLWFCYLKLKYKLEYYKKMIQFYIWIWFDLECKFEIVFFIQLWILISVFSFCEIYSLWL